MAKISSPLTTLLENHEEEKMELDLGGSEELINLSATERGEENGHAFITVR